MLLTAMLLTWLSANPTPEASNALLVAGLLVSHVEDLHRGKVAGALLGKTKTVFEANPAAIERALPDLAAWSERWTAFVSDADDVSVRLLALCAD